MGTAVYIVKGGDRSRCFRSLGLQIQTNRPIVRTAADTDTDTDTDTSVVNPTRRPQPTNLQNLVTIMEYVVRVATFEG